MMLGGNISTSMWDNWQFAEPPSNSGIFVCFKWLLWASQQWYYHPVSYQKVIKQYFGLLCGKNKAGKPAEFCLCMIFVWRLCSLNDDAAACGATKCCSIRHSKFPTKPQCNAVFLFVFANAKEPCEQTQCTNVIVQIVQNYISTSCTYKNTYSSETDKQGHAWGR